MSTKALDALRVLDNAPIVEIKEIGTDENGQCRVLAFSTPEELAKGPPLVYRRVRLVPVLD